MNLVQLELFLAKNNLPSFRKKQILKAVYSQAGFLFSEITELSLDLRTQLDKEFKVNSLQEKQVYVSKDGTVKALLNDSTGQPLETVLMIPKPGLLSVCVSSQIGCAMACSFCATGKMGFKRNLQAYEIIDQVLFWKQYLKKQGSTEHISNIVFMGMGEPFANYNNVIESTRMLRDKGLFGMGSRSISISSSGLVPGIAKFAQEPGEMNLAISLHSANNEKRSKLMPVNRAYNLEKLGAEIKKYLELSNRKVFIEYIMLDQENDGLEDAQELAIYLKSVGPQRLVHVNLIRFNQTDSPHVESALNRLYAFKNYMIDQGYPTTIRKNLGQDINGACGQLAGKE